MSPRIEDRAGTGGGHPPGGGPILVLVLSMVPLALWTSQALDRRSLAGTALDHVVIASDVRREKHPGVDDRYFVTLQPSGGGRRSEVEITRAVHGRLAIGSRLEKTAGEKEARVDGQAVPLPPDPLASGLRVALAASVVPAALALVWRRLRR